MSKAGYKKLKGTTGVYKHLKSKNYLATKKVNGKLEQRTFRTLFEATQWREQVGHVELPTEVSDFSSLKTVWEIMQRVHFPTLATSTKAIWHRRYEPLKKIENLPMDQITPSKITKWVTELVEFYRSDDYQNSGRGRASRCNLDNELNLLKTIFNWYKESEEFEREAMKLTCPVKKKHKKMGFIKPVPERKKQIDLEHFLSFLNYLKPLYRDLAEMQFWTAGRIGEIAGLQWSNIDLTNRRMLIKHTCIWDMTHKTFLELKPFPKNREPRPVYIHDSILRILKQREAFKELGNDYVFPVEGKPLNYGTIQLNYREATRKGKLPYSGTHILRHGMAKLARKIGGGLDAVIAMTGHKDIKLADHYSKCNEDDQKEVSQKILEHVQQFQMPEVESQQQSAQNVISFAERRAATKGA